MPKNNVKMIADIEEEEEKSVVELLTYDRNQLRIIIEPKT